MKSSLSLFMIGVLLLNDHVLKGAFPGLITGKLSDLAGPFVLYGVLRGVPPMGLKPLGALGVTMAFAISIKTSQPLADLVSGATCGWIFSSCGFIADPWDLVAYIPFVLWFLWEQRKIKLTTPSPSAACPEISPHR